MSCGHNRGSRNETHTPDTAIRHTRSHDNHPSVEIRMEQRPRVKKQYCASQMRGSVVPAKGEAGWCQPKARQCGASQRRGSVVLAKGEPVWC